MGDCKRCNNTRVVQKFDAMAGWYSDSCPECRPVMHYKNAEIARLTAEVARINAERSDDITIAVMAERQRIKDELLDGMAAADRRAETAELELAALRASVRNIEAHVIASRLSSTCEHPDVCYCGACELARKVAEMCAAAIHAAV